LARMRLSSGSLLPRLTSTMIGRSDQGGCSSSSLKSSGKRGSVSASCVTRTAPAPPEIAPQSGSTRAYDVSNSPRSCSAEQANSASRPRVARSRTVYSGLPAISIVEVHAGARISRPAGHHVLEVPEHRSHLYARPQPEFADAALMGPQALLHHGDA